MQNRIPKQIVFGEPARSVFEGKPVYGLKAEVDGHTYFVTWEHYTRYTALMKLKTLAALTGTPWAEWLEQFWRIEDGDDLAGQLVELNIIDTRKPR